MKILYYSFLVICLSFVTSCIEDLQEQDRPVLSEEELALNYLQYTNHSVLLGKVEINETGEWTNGWIINNKREVKEVEFTGGLQPGNENEIEVGQMKEISRQGNFLFEVDDKITLVEHVKEVEKMPLYDNLEKVAGEAYFAVVSTVESQSNISCGVGEIAACGGDSDHDNVEATLYNVKYLTTGEAELSASVAKAAVQWLESINSQLN